MVFAAQSLASGDDVRVAYWNGSAGSSSIACSTTSPRGNNAAQVYHQAVLREGALRAHEAEKRNGNSGRLDRFAVGG